MRNPLTLAVGFISRHRPEQAGRFVMPYLTLALTLLVILGTVQIKENRDHNDETRRALCALRGDLEQRIQGSREFLTTHPGGAFGVPASTIRVSVEGQERTVAVLGFLEC